MMTITRNLQAISQRLVVGAISIVALASTDCATKEAHASGFAPPVVVELFTSEGCSSCPPADAVLADLEAKQPVNGATIIPLAFHVDYWDNANWKDPFSRAEWTDRQRNYASALPDHGVYTPEMIVDGRDSFVGSRASRAQSAIADAAKKPKATLSLVMHETKNARSIGVIFGALPSSAAGTDLVVAITDRHAHVNVGGGENGGRALDHTAIVKSLRVIGAVTSSGGTFDVDVDPSWTNKRAVVFLQERASRAIVGAATLSL